MTVIRPTTKGELHWWKDSHVFKSGIHEGDKRTDMYVMEAITESKYKAFGPSNPMAYRLVFYVSRRLNEVRMGYSQHGRYSGRKKKVTLIWNFMSKTTANQWFSKMKKQLTSATTFGSLMHKIALLKRDARKYKGRVRG